MGQEPKLAVSRKKIILIVASAAMALMAAGTAVLLYARPDWQFFIKDSLARFTVSALLVQVQADSLAERSLEDLLKDGRTELNQSLMLINPDHLIGERFEPQIGYYKETDVKMNVCMMDSYARLSASIGERFDDKLYVLSAYRTAEEQQQAIAQETENAAQLYASEHQAGLALDVCVRYFAGNSFIKTDVGQYVNLNCWQYGFIIRYPYYNNTGLPYEPWHIRYVGAPHAEILYKNSWTLEDYMERLEAGQFYQYGDYLITRQRGDTFSIPADYTQLVISPDNLGGYILTFKLS